MKKIGIFALLMCPAVAMAHPGHAEAGFISGFFHPFTGMDHLAAMFGVGLVCSLFFSKESTFKWTVLSVLAMSLVVGAFSAVAGLQIPMVESMILLSVVFAGILLFTGGLGRSINKWIVCSLAALSASHGYVHILEGSAVANFGQYTAGFILSSLVLYSAGLVLGSKVSQVSMKPQLGVISGGIYMALAVVLAL